jgi:hypothetical protein
MEVYMALIWYSQSKSSDLDFRYVSGTAETFGVGMAILDRGDKLIRITPNRGEFPIEVEQIQSAKSVRDEFLAQGIPCAPLPEL